VDRLREAQTATNSLIDAQIVEIATTSELGDAYAEAARKAQAFYEFDNRKTTRGGGGGPTAAPTGPAAPTFDPNAMVLSGSAVFDPTPFQEASAHIENAAQSMASLNEGFQSLDIVSSDWSHTMGDISSLFQVIAETDFKSAEEKIENILHAAGAVASTVSNMIGNVIRKSMRDNDELSDKQKASLKRLFIAQKAFAIVSIGIDTAMAAMKAMGALPPPGNFIVAGATVAMGVAQAAIVAGQKAPFHTGGIIPAAPGKQGVMINALPGESVLSREATAGLGSEGVGALNSGGGTAPQVIEMVYKHRIFDTFVADNIAKGGPLQAAVRQGRRVGHRGSA